MTNDNQSVAVLSPDLEAKYLSLAKQAALEAGKVQMAGFGMSHTIDTKGTAIDLVTAIDKECDALIVSMLEKGAPNTLLLTEETFQEQQQIDLSNTWVVDPLDGTTNYAHGFPQFAVSIAYFQDGLPVIGVVYDAFKKELFYAIRHRGAFLNDKPIFVSANRVHALSNALLATGFPYDIATSQITNLDHFQRIAPRCQGVRRPGAAALDLAYLACGRLDAYWELKLSVWDIAAGALLVEEAGGAITGLHGEPLNYAQRRIDLVGSNGTDLHGELCTLLNTGA
jgi:myo-inositol-1(or 4)-monophosphatase